ncbi:hypothetical protein C8R45DRAFT_618339 [Mycena sanguinolenta]|nr:hypothetical protein C8R45DRAFT_618339 [Mycena sanguinolenta]
MSLIEFFPPEILAEIFTNLSQDPSEEITTVSHVSRWWRCATLGCSELWINIHILEKDVNHADVVLDHFGRSQQRPISLCLEFTAEEPPATPSQVHAFLKSVVRPNIARCDKLMIWAVHSAWEVILAAFEQETYPLLRELSILDLRHSSDELVFPLPQNHPLEELIMVAINVGEVALPQIRELHVSDFCRLVGADGCINSWLLHGPKKLELCHMEIPPMHFQIEEERVVGVSSVEYLLLSKIYASNTQGIQHDCAPFFDALQTPLIRTLQLEEFHGRVWEDFLFALQTPTVKYPLLTTLVLKSFDFQDLSYAGIAFFLHSFPALEWIMFFDCPLATWECCIHTLMLRPTLCPSVFAVVVNGVLLNRNEPLPFATACLVEDEEASEHRDGRAGDEN